MLILTNTSTTSTTSTTTTCAIWKTSYQLTSTKTSKLICPGTRTRSLPLKTTSLSTLNFNQIKQRHLNSTWECQLSPLNNRRKIIRNCTVTKRQAISTSSRDRKRFPILCRNQNKLSIAKTGRLQVLLTFRLRRRCLPWN